MATTSSLGSTDFAANLLKITTNTIVSFEWLRKTWPDAIERMPELPVVAARPSNTLLRGDSSSATGSRLLQQADSKNYSHLPLSMVVITGQHLSAFRFDWMTIYEEPEP